MSAFRIILVVVLAVGCSTPVEDPRRERLRARLRVDLGDRYDLPLEATTAEEIRRGSQLYETLCESCHGPRGDGNGKAAQALTTPVPDLADPVTAGFFSDRAKLRIITEGSPGTPMIGWGMMLEEADRLAVLHFMNSLVTEPPSP